MIEFVLLAVTLAVPLVDLLLAVFDVQRAAYGASSATREAGRVFVRAPSTADAEARAKAAASVALADHGLSLADGELLISCSASPCLTPGASVRITFHTNVSLPLMPSLGTSSLTSLPVSAAHTQIVDQYSEIRP